MGLNKSKFKINLTEQDYAYLSRLSDLSREELKSIFLKYCQRNPNGLLSKAEFKAIYCELRSYESMIYLDDITNYVFGYFDADVLGSITFNQLISAFSLLCKRKSCVLVRKPNRDFCNKCGVNCSCLVQERCNEGQMNIRNFDLDHFLNNVADTIIVRRDGPDIRIIVPGERKCLNQRVNQNINNCSPCCNKR